MRVSIIGTKDQIKEVLREFVKDNHEPREDELNPLNEAIKAISLLRFATENLTKQPVELIDIMNASHHIESAITTLSRAHKFP